MHKPIAMSVNLRAVLRLPVLLLLVLAPLPGLVAACPSTPETMRAARIHAAGGPEALRVESVPVPRPEAGELLVRVHYASINPVDWKLQEAGRLPFPATPGGDFAGEIVALGDGVTGYACGDRVAGIADPRGRGGSYAEYVAVPLDAVVPSPPAFSMAEAAAHPTVTIAAWRFMIAGADLQRGERVLIHGGAGGVGSMAVQIAKALGAYVIATASAANHDFLRELGADETIDYRSTRFEDVVRDVDVVVDTVGGDTLLRSEHVLRDGGRLVTLAGRLPPELCGRIVCPPTAPWDVQAGLAFAAPLIAAGRLRVHIERRYPLDAISDAQQHNRSGRTRGKIVVDLGAAPAGTATH
jgi:NADPH:quinone reductase-like Zn-dependent oxidoreductase